MTNAEIDKLFVVMFAPMPEGPSLFVERINWQQQRDGFRAAMKSEHVKALERVASRLNQEARVEGMREAASICDKQRRCWPMDGPNTADTIREAIRQRAYQIEREGESK